MDLVLLCPVPSTEIKRPNVKMIKNDPLLKSLSPNDLKEKTKKLEDYFALLGFRNWTEDIKDKDDSSELQVWGIWTGHEQPHIKRVVPHLFQYPTARMTMF